MAKNFNAMVQNVCSFSFRSAIDKQIYANQSFKAIPRLVLASTRRFVDKRNTKAGSADHICGSLSTIQPVICASSAFIADAWLGCTLQ